MASSIKKKQLATLLFYTDTHSIGRNIWIRQDYFQVHCKFCIIIAMSAYPFFLIWFKAD